MKSPSGIEVEIGQMWRRPASRMLGEVKRLYPKSNVVKMTFRTGKRFEFMQNIPIHLLTNQRNRYKLVLPDPPEAA